jgi:hypothetical protein
VVEEMEKEWIGMGRCKKQQQRVKEAEREK